MRAKVLKLNELNINKHIGNNQRDNNHKTESIVTTKQYQ